MTLRGDDSAQGIRVRLPRPTGTGNDLTINSESFPVPAGKVSMAVHIPAMTGTGATVKLQALFPAANDQVTEVWTDVSVFNLADGTFVALDGMVESTTVTLPVAATGGGTLMFVASETQAAAPITLGVTFI